MAAKVNVKFVVLLSGFLVLAAVGVGGAYFFVKYRSGDRCISRGDSALKAGNIDLADSWYERGVGKDPTKIEWMKKWKAVREKKIPKTQTEYTQNYQMYQNILRSLSLTLKTDVEAHREYLEAVYQEVTFSPAKGAWEALARETEDHLRFFDQEPPLPLVRYRAIAGAQLTSIDPTATQEVRDQAGKDLEMILKANPKDGQIAMELALWHRAMADRAKSVGNEEERKRHFDAARPVLAGVLAADPTNSFALIGMLTLDASDVELVGADSKNQAEVLKARVAAMDALAPRVKVVADALKAAGPAKIPVMLFNRFVSIAPRIDAKTGADIAMSVVDAGLTAEPENLDLLLSKAQLNAQQTKLDDLITVYQKVIDLKDQPVSFTGMRLLAIRNRARFAQANASLQMASQAKDNDSRKAGLERAKSFRTKLAAFVPEQSPELQFIDAEIASIEGNTARARQLLAEFLKKPGDAAEATVVEATLLMADVGLRSTPPELGLARENLRKVLAARPGSIEVRFLLANIERQLQNFGAAAGYYKSIVDLDPENKVAAAELKTLETYLSGGKSDDPVINAILEAQRLSRGSESKLGDDEAAGKYLQDALETYKYDPRLVVPLLGMKISKGDRDGAKKLAEVALQKAPTEGLTEEKKAVVEQIKELQRRLIAAETPEGMIKLLDEQKNLSVVDRQMAIYRMYLEFGKADEAAAALKEASKASPDDFRIIEIQFQQALKANDTAESSRLAERAAKLDLDHAEGETFKARIQISQKQYRDAAATLGRVVDRGNAQAAVYRLLGLVQAELGRMPDAKASFQRALDLTPNDLITVKTYISALTRAGETAEALAVARSSEAIGRNDPEFLNAWLSLESQSGNLDRPRAGREQLYQRNPKDMENAAALADIYIDDKAWAAARKIIDAMRTESDSLRAAALDARWYASQGDVARAKNVYKQFISQLIEKGETKLTDPYVVFGQFLFSQGQDADGISALKQAARSQDPATRPVDVMIGDYQLSTGRFDEAEKSYRLVLDAKVPDPDLKIRKRLIEALNQQKKFAEAEAQFVACGPRAEEDVELMAQRASAARGAGDMVKAREILDRAVSKFPEEPVPYLRRARMLMVEPGMTKDALADLATAIKLRPTFWQALRTRAMLQIAAGKTDEAMQDLRDAADRNQANEDLRLELIDYLIRFGKESDAVDAANSAVKLRPSDVRLMSQLASIFVRNGRLARASKFYKSIWEQVQDERSAVDYIHSLLIATPPGTADAEAVLASPKLKVDKSARLLLYRGLVKKKMNKEDGWKADTLSSFDIACASGDALLTWTQDVRTAYPDSKVCMAIFNMAKPPPALQDWINLAVCSLAAEDPKGQDEAVVALHASFDRANDRNLKLMMIRKLTEILIAQSKWEAAIKELEAGLKIAPSELDFSNNIAAILTEHLKRPKDAIPYAEKAVAGDPGNWAYLDTLSDAYLESGDKAQALRRVQDSVNAARSEVDKARARIKLATWKLRSGSKAEASMLIRELREMMTDNPTLADLTKTEMQALTKEFDAAPGN